MANGNNSMDVGTAIKAKAMDAVHGTVDFIKNPRKVAGLAMAGATLSLVTACGPSSTPETPVSPVPTPSNIDMPTIKPTTEMPSTQPSTQETNKGDSCVGQTFGGTFIEAWKSIRTCLTDEGYTNIAPGGSFDYNGDGRDDRRIDTNQKAFIMINNGNGYTLEVYDK